MHNQFEKGRLSLILLGFIPLMMSRPLLFSMRLPHVTPSDFIQPLFLIIFDFSIIQWHLFQFYISHLIYTMSVNEPISNSEGCPEIKLTSSISAQSNQDLHLQINHLKENAHQSFMQVIQMQQLHEEEIQEMRMEYQQKEYEWELRLTKGNQKIKELSNRIEELQTKCNQLQHQNNLYDRNYKHHCLQFEEDVFLLSNIDTINCQEESKLDESSIISFKEIIETNIYQQKINSIREHLLQEITTICNLTNNHDQFLKIEEMLKKIFDYIAYLKAEFTVLFDKAAQHHKICEQLEIKSKNAKNICESLQKESKFMTEHIKKICNDKLAMEKRLIEADKNVRNYQILLKQLQIALSKRGFRLQELLNCSKVSSLTKNRINEEYENSLDINNLNELNFTKATMVSQLAPTITFERFARARKI